MQKLIVPFLLLTGCSTTQIQEPIKSEPREVEVIYGPSSELTERAAGVEFERNRHISGSDKAASNEVSKTPVLSSLLQKNRAEARGAIVSKTEIDQMLVELVKVGKKEKSQFKEFYGGALVAYRQGNIALAHEKVSRLWEFVNRSRAGVLEKELEYSPYKESAFVFALIELKTAQRAKGVQLLESLIFANRTWALPYVALSEHYLDENAPTLALRVSLAGIDRLPAPPSALFVSSARAYKSLGNAGAAQDILLRASKALPLSSEVALWRGVLEYEAGSFVSACEKFRFAYERSPSSATAVHNVSLCFIREEQWEQAENVLKLGMIQSPEAAHLKFLFGRVAKMLGRFTAARSAWNEYLTLAGPQDSNRIYVESELHELKVSSLLESRLKTSGSP